MLILGSWYLGVMRDSFSTCDINDSSIPRFGKVWLRGRWKCWLGSGRLCWAENSWLSLGEKLNGVVGVVGPAEKEDGAESVNALLDSEVAL